MFVASIDVGIVNLAVVFVELDDLTYDIIQINHLANVNSTVFEHNVVTVTECTLGHARSTADRVTHFVQERKALFDACVHVLIERQPLMGHTDVEQVLFLLFRHKAELVSPNAMHKFFNISRFSYESRKVKTVMLSDQFLTAKDFPMYHSLPRKHDIADALCLLMFWIHQRKLAATVQSTELVSGLLRVKGSRVMERGSRLGCVPKLDEEVVGIGVGESWRQNEVNETRGEAVSQNEGENVGVSSDDDGSNAVPAFNKLLQKYRFSSLSGNEASTRSREIKAKPSF